MIITSSRFTPRTRLKRDLSPRRLAGSARSRTGEKSLHERVQLLMLEKTLPKELRTPPPGGSKKTTDKFHLPQVFLTEDKDAASPRPRPATTIPQIRIRPEHEPDDNELQVRAIDLVAMANDEHRSSTSMTRHRLVESMSEIDRVTPVAKRRPHTVAVTERIMENKLLNLKYKQYPCIRAESILNEELTENINDLSRECCDVFGPNMCQECKKIYHRNENTLQNESFFPSITISTTSISTMTLARRHLPNYSPWEIQRMIADGDIGELAIKRDKFADKAKEFHNGMQTGDELFKLTRRISAFNVPDKQSFFSSINDLRAQMEARRLGGRRGRRKAVIRMTDDDETPGHIPQEIDIEPEYDKEKYDERLGPPLMTCEEMVYQHNQPRFYAGTKFEYELPKPPPMAELIERATAAMSLMENTSSGALDDNPEIEAWRKARKEYENEKKEKEKAAKEKPKVIEDEKSSSESESEEESENMSTESEKSQPCPKTDNLLDDAANNNLLKKPPAQVRTVGSGRKRSVVVQPIIEEEAEEPDS
ncbi:uncharacterized protein [Ptychodera flava]